MHGTQIAHADEPAKLERLARYIARAPFSLGKIHDTQDGRIRVQTPPDPRTGARDLVLDALEFIHRVTTQIPDARRHLIRHYGAYSHRSRGARRARAEAEAAGAAAAAGGGVPGDSEASAPLEIEPPASPSRASWARLIRRIYEVDPLLCPRCQGQLELLAVLVDPTVVGAILRHLDVSEQPRSVHARDPPAACGRAGGCGEKLRAAMRRVRWGGSVSRQRGDDSERRTRACASVSRPPVARARVRRRVRARVGRIARGFSRRRAAGCAAVGAHLGSAEGRGARYKPLSVIEARMMKPESIRGGASLLADLARARPSSAKMFAPWQCPADASVDTSAADQVTDRLVEDHEG